MRKRIALLTALALAALLVLPLAADAAPRGGGQGQAGDVLTNPRALARALRLTEQQVATLRTLLEDLKETTEPLREEGKALRDALRAEIEAATPNACEVGTAALAVHENHEEIEDARQAFDTAFTAILTPEQRVKYEALKELLRPRQGEED
jgi:Spy/CpxP family protein refolding chaperone